MIYIWLALVFLGAQDPVGFVDTMTPYYGFEVNYSYKDLGYYNGEPWWGATVWVPGGCINQVYLDDQFENDETQLWKGVLAHEWAHVAQGPDCVDNERGADQMALENLWKAKEVGAWTTWSQFLMEVH
jgi:hypothetical protein